MILLVRDGYEKMGEAFDITQRAHAENHFWQMANVESSESGWRVSEARSD